MAQLYRACWAFTRPQQQMPPFVTPGAPAVAPVGVAGVSPAPTTAAGVGSTATANAALLSSTLLSPRVHPGIGPSYSKAELQRALLWEKTARNVPEHINEILPPPLLKPQATDLQKRVEADEFERLCEEARFDRSSCIEREEAAERVRDTDSLLSELFSGTKPKPRRKRSREVEAHVKLCASWLRHRKLDVHREAERETLRAESALKRWKSFSEQSFTLLHQMRVVRTNTDLKNVASAFTQRHGQAWRARMPSNVQMRRKLPLSGPPPRIRAV